MKTLDMPSFGADMETGKVVEWCVQPGDTVHKGDTVALIETAKGLIDMEVFDDGVIAEFLVELDTDIAVGIPLIAMQAVGEKDPVADLPKAPSVATADNVVVLPTKAPETNATLLNMPSVATFGSNRRLTPAAKKYLAEHPQSIQSVVGSGMAGAICLRDLTSAAQVADVAKPPAQRGVFDSNAMRQAIANVVSKSKREIPHYYLSQDVDLDRAEQWLAQMNEEREPEQRLLINVPIMCAVARALHKHPDFNGFYEAGVFRHSPEVHLGVAIRLRNKGLVTPAIHNANQLDAVQMMQQLKSIVERAKLGGLKQSELQDATTTLTNIGDRGSDQIYGVIFPPQVAIIGVGRVLKRPVVSGDQIVIHSVVNLTLSADHRVTDGQMGAKLLNDMSKMLQNPEQFAGGIL